MKALVAATLFAAASAASFSAPAADWVWQQEQTRNFQKKAAEKRAAKEREAWTASPAELPSSHGQRSPGSGRGSKDASKQKQ